MTISLPIPPELANGSPLIGEPDPVNAALFATQYELAAKRFEYLVARRDQVEEKLRFGALAINGASLVGLISALSGEGSAAKWLGFDARTAPISACAFFAGVLFAALSLTIDSNRQAIEAGKAYARQSDCSILAALYKAPPTKARIEQIAEVMKRYHELDLVDFDYSVSSIIFRNLAGLTWLAGLAVPLSHALF